MVRKSEVATLVTIRKKARKITARSMTVAHGKLKVQNKHNLLQDDPLRHKASFAFQHELLMKADLR